MSNKRVREDYRQHVIVADRIAGKFIGRIWKGNKRVHDVEGNNISDAATRSKLFIDEQIGTASSEAGETPDEARVMEGFRTIEEQLHDGQRAMLKAHYHAKNQTMTTSELAAAAGYKTHHPVNVHYGNIGKWLYELAPIDLPKYSDGSPIYTFYLAEATDDAGEQEFWHWKLRPEVSNAILALGLHA